MSEPAVPERKVNLRFSELEDRKLQELVGQFGAKRWKRIAQFMPGRDARQCRDRYNNYLSPDFYNTKWTKDDDLLLYEKYKIYGPKWTKITEFFPGKNANNIKNRWNYWVSHINFGDKAFEINTYLSNLNKPPNPAKPPPKVTTGTSPSTAPPIPQVSTTQDQDINKNVEFSIDLSKVKNPTKPRPQQRFYTIPLIPESVSTSNQGLFSNKFPMPTLKKENGPTIIKLPPIETMISLIKE